MSDIPISDLKSAIEAILFTAGEAVEIKRISSALNIKDSDVISIADSLMDEFNTKKSGIHIMRINDSYQMRTNPGCFPYVSAVFENQPKKNLTPALLETLAIIAYKQPVTKTEIEEIRGVNADHAVNRLMELNLVCEKGRDSAPGKPILFGTTEEFLRYFDFSRIENLPDLPAISEEEIRLP